jgi:endoglucanase
VQLGKAIAIRISAEEIVQTNAGLTFLLPGPDGFRASPSAYILNPSYLPLPLVNAVADELPATVWKRLAASTPGFLTHSSSNGFAADWVRYSSDTGYVSTAGSNTRAGGSYDAIRVYLWAGMTHPRTPGRDQVLRALGGMSAYLRDRERPPEVVLSDGTVLSTHSPIGFSAALIPFLDALDQPTLLGLQRSRLDAGHTPSGLYGRDQTYYDQNLALFALGWSEHRFRFDAMGHLRLAWKQS